MTPAQKIVMAFKDGLSRKAVARKFGVSLKTVDAALRDRLCPCGRRRP